MAPPKYSPPAVACFLPAPPTSEVNIPVCMTAFGKLTLCLALLPFDVSVSLSKMSDSAYGACYVAVLFFGSEGIEPSAFYSLISYDECVEAAWDYLAFTSWTEQLVYA